MDTSSDNSSIDESPKTKGKAKAKGKAGAKKKAAGKKKAESKKKDKKGEKSLNEVLAGIIDAETTAENKARIIHLTHECDRYRAQLEEAENRAR